MTGTDSAVDAGRYKTICGVLPDDGTDKRLLLELRNKQGIVRAGSEITRGIAALGQAKSRRGKLPEPSLVRRIFVICSEDQADEVFEFMFWSAQIDKPGRGALWQQSLIACSPYELPADVPDESVDG